MSETGEVVLYEVRDAVALVTINRPERRNALGGTVREDLCAAVGKAEDDPAVRAIVLTGVGTTFCAGGDLTELLAATQAPEGRPLRDKLDPQRDRTLLAIYEARKPVIAAVNGPALGAGMNLALAADIRLASSAATFTQSYVRRGLPPDYGGTFLLPRAVGVAKALELVFTAATIDAAEALRIGLVNQVVAPDALLDEALRMAGEIALGAPLALRLAKQTIHASTEGDLRDAQARETAALNVCYDTRDGREGLAAFVEKRAPVFEGR